MPIEIVPKERLTEVDQKMKTGMSAKSKTSKTSKLLLS